MRAMLAHQGGWDELVIPLAVVGAFVYGSRRKRARERGGAGRPVAAHASQIRREDGSVDCDYCGGPIPQDASRCPACGFKKGPTP